MATESVQVVQAGFELFAREGLEGLGPVLDPEVEVFADATVLNSGTFHGTDGFMQWSSNWFDAWKELSYDPQDFIEVGERIVVVPTIQHGVGAGSGIEVEQEIVWMMEVREGRIRRFHLYADVETAMAAARGLAADGAQAAE